MPASLHSDLSDEIHMCRGLFHCFCNQQRKCRVMHFGLCEVNWLMRVSVIFQPCTFRRLSVLRRKVLEKGDSLCPRGCFHSPLEGGRTSSALGMCVDTHSSDHVMA